MVQIYQTDIEKQLPDLLNAARNGEEILIIMDNDEIIRLVPTPLAERHPKYGSAKGLIEIADDFDAPLEDFSEYMP